MQQQSISEQLVEQVRQKASSGKPILAVINTDEDGTQLLHLEFNQHYGLLVNEQPATLDFYRELADFHILEVAQGSGKSMMLH